LDVLTSGVAAPGSRAITSPPLSTSSGNELLVAFIAADGPNQGSSQTIASVSGAGLSWSLAVRANAQSGTAEVWTAYATSKVYRARVRALPARSGFEGSISLAAFKGARAAVGATGSASGPSRQPTVSLTTRVQDGWVWGVGDDWDNGIARTPAAGQALQYQYVDHPIGNTFWVQDRTDRDATAGTPVVLSDTSPTTDRWDYAALEIDPATPQVVVAGTPPPTTAAPSSPSTTADPPSPATTVDPPSPPTTTGTPAPTTTTAAPQPTTTTAAPLPQGGGVSACGLAQAAFCETFNSPAGIGNRAGDLNGTLWGVSRLTANENFSAPANGWATSSLNPCGEAATAAPHDVQICNGEVHDSLNDGGTVAALAMYPKQPFDFAGRTGKIVFDVSNDSQGNHAAWPELWVSDQPVPDPFTHESTLQSVPRNGFGIRFAGCSNGTCPRGNGTVGVDSAIVVNNYTSNDSFNGGSLQVQTLDSVTQSGPGQLNHYEIDVSQGQIDVYATDAFTPGSALPALRHIATIPNAGLSFTRGLVWLVDAHYNANKFNSQGDHTFTWDNVGFDGPVLPRDLAFDVPDNNGGSTSDPNGVPATNLGYFIGANSSLNVVDPGLYNVGNASAALLTFGYYVQTPPSSFNVSINGHAVNFAIPVQPQPYSPGTIAVPIPLADVVNGNNTITFTTGGNPMTVMNIDLIMVGAAGVVSPS
jgi:hypothetical protein